MDRQFLQSDFIPIPTSIINGDSVCGFDLYICEGGSLVLFASKSVSSQRSIVSKIKNSSIKTLYVNKHDSEACSQFLQNSLQHILNQNIPTETKAKLLYDTTGSIMQDFFENPQTPESISSAKSVASAILGNILSNEKAFISLVKVSAYDYYTYTHSINVSIYAIGIGRFMGLGSDDLDVLAKAAILHDIGKSRVDPKVLNKSGQLSYDEFLIIQKHATYGWEMLRELGESDVRVLDAVRHHHEKMDGSGYPDRLKGNEISFFARILAVADVFDALNTRRCYKDAISTFYALREMRKKMYTHLDGEILQNFIHCMHGELGVTKK